MLRVSTAVLAVTLAVCAATAAAQTAVTTTAATAKNTTAPGTTRMATMAPKTTIPAASQPPATFGKSVLMATVMLTGNFTPFVTNGKFGELKSAVSMGLNQLMRVNSPFFFVRRQWLSNSSMMTEFAVSDKAGVAPAELVRRVMTATTNMTWATAAQGVFRKYTGKNFVVQRPQVITMAPTAMNTTRPAATTTPGSSSIPATFGAEALVVTLVLTGDFSAFSTPTEFARLKTTMEAAIAVLMKLDPAFLFIKRMWIASLHTEFAVSAKAGVSVTELSSRAETATTNTTWATGLRQLGATFTIERPIVRTPAPANATTTAAPALSGTPAVVSAAAAVLAAAAAVLAL